MINILIFFIQSLHRSESMLSLACYKTLSQLIHNDDTTELLQYIASNKNINIDDRDEVRIYLYHQN